jgi:tetratricopeptide (TPR) repeat protein
MKYTQVLVKSVVGGFVAVVISSCCSLLTFAQSIDSECKEAHKLWEDQKYSESLAKYSDIHKRSPDSADALFGIGIVKESLRDYDGAIKSLDEATALRPDFADAYAERADCYFAICDLKKALAETPLIFSARMAQLFSLQRSNTINQRQF